MKTVFTFSLAFTVALLALVPNSTNAQGGNPLMNIPVTANIPGTNYAIENAKISITDFDVEGNDIYISSTLTGSVLGQPLPPTSVRHLVTISSATCDLLRMIIGAPCTISTESFQLGFVSVNISSKLQKNDNSLTNTLCSIAKLYQSNASPNTIVAKLKQLVRSFS